MKKKNKLKNNGSLLIMLCFMLVGAVCGISIITYIDYLFWENIPISEMLLNLLIAVIELYIAFFVQIIVHEFGHLIFGRLSGYEFLSFRIASFMWVKNNGKIKFCRYSIAGTGGQCLMSPPDLKNGKMPFVLYNLGGCIMNIITIPICAVLFVFFSKAPFLSIFLMLMCIIGFVFVLINGIPMKLGAVNNDGYNAKELGKSSEALKSFWIQMKANEQITKGVRIKHMPQEWFYLPDESQMKNSMTAVIAVLYENRLMDSQNFDEVKRLIDKILAQTSGIVGLHKNLLICDRLYCELIGGKNKEIIDGLYTKEQIKFMKQMRNFLAVIRTEYAYTLLYKNDFEKAAQIKKQFEKCSKKYPYSCEIESEMELLEIAEQAALKFNNNNTSL